MTMAHVELSRFPYLKQQTAWRVTLKFLVKCHFSFNRVGIS